MKLKCNKCFQELVTHEYEEKHGIQVYVDPCECVEADFNDELEAACEQAYDNGYSDGTYDGFQAGVESVEGENP